MPVACPGIRRGGGGGDDLIGFFLLINFSSAQKTENSRENDISDQGRIGNEKSM